jgi:hypothetical protein
MKVAGGTVATPVDPPAQFEDSWLPFPALPAEKLDLAREIDRLCQNAAIAAGSQFTRAELWQTLNLALGIASTALAAVVGVSAIGAFVSVKVVGAGALLTAVLGAINTALESGKKVESAAAAGNAYLRVRDALRQLGCVDLPSASVEDAREELRQLTNRLHEINASADLHGRLTRRLARRFRRVERRIYLIDNPAMDVRQRTY